MTAILPASQPSHPASTPAPAPPRVVVGVDTHQQTHTAALIDTRGVRLGHHEFPATARGYRDLVTWAASHGTLIRFGIESTGSYGAGLTRHLLTPNADQHTDCEVVEVNRPEKTTRIKHGKSDPVDAYSAAEQALTGRAQAHPKLTTGIVEAIRAVKVPRDVAVRHRTAAFNQLRDLITTAPDPLRDQLLPLSARGRVSKALALRPDPTRLADPLHATRHALRALARRITALDTEIHEADAILADLTAQACPTLLAMPQIGPQSAAQLIITAGENIDRMRTEATFAKLTGVAPLPASSGKTTRHRLNRGGDRAANSALYLIVIGRMRNHPPTRDYLTRRRAEGLSNPEIIRCLKRHLARTVYQALRTDLMTP